MTGAKETCPVTRAVPVQPRALLRLTVVTHPAGMAYTLALGLTAHSVAGTVAGARSLGAIGARVLGLAHTLAFDTLATTRAHAGAGTGRTVVARPVVLTHAYSVEALAFVGAVIRTRHNTAVQPSELLEASARAVVTSSTRTADGGWVGGWTAEGVACVALPVGVTATASVSTHAVTVTIVGAQGDGTIWTAETVMADALAVYTFAIRTSVALRDSAVVASPPRIASTHSGIAITVALTGTVAWALVERTIGANVSGIATAQAIFADSVA